MVLLPSFEANGLPGKKGADGTSHFGTASPGRPGRDGTHATAATAGGNAGEIKLTLFSEDSLINMQVITQHPDKNGQSIQQSYPYSVAGKLRLSAHGGRGGDGAKGGQGEGGGRGSKGQNATKSHSGGNGTDGASGGNGGNGSSGARGGAAGNIEILVNERDTHLLMLCDVPNVEGGAGGEAGANGAGGSGGDGGAGGDSLSWMETQTIYQSQCYTDAMGNIQSRQVPVHIPVPKFMAGGSRGSDGSRGSNGTAALHAGSAGAKGSYSYVVRENDGSTRSYKSIYEPKLTRFTLRNESTGTNIHEPGSLVSVHSLVIKNKGGMPTPSATALELQVAKSNWIQPVGDHLLVSDSIIPNADFQVQGQLLFRIPKFTSVQHGEARKESDSVIVTAKMSQINRASESFPLSQVIEVCYPIEMGVIVGKGAMASGSTIELSLSIKNLSTKSVGGTIRRVLIEVKREKGDLPATLLSIISLGNTKQSGKMQNVTSKLLYDVPVIAAKQSITSRFQLALASECESYTSCHLHFSLLLASFDEQKTEKWDKSKQAIVTPQALHLVQTREFVVTASQQYSANPRAQLVLLTSTHTTRDEYQAWHGLAATLNSALDVWDITLMGRFDLKERTGADGPILAETLRGKILILSDDAFDLAHIDIPNNASQSARESTATSLDYFHKDQMIEALETYGISLYVTQALSDTAASDFADEFLVSANPVHAESPGVKSFETGSALLQAASKFQGIQRLSLKPRVIALKYRGDGEYLAYKQAKIAKELQALHPERRYVITYRARSSSESGNFEGIIEVRRSLDRMPQNSAIVLRLEPNLAALHTSLAVYSQRNIYSLLAAYSFPTKLVLLQHMASQSDKVELRLKLKEVILQDLALEQKLLRQDNMNLTRFVLRSNMPKLDYFCRLCPFLNDKENCIAWLETLVGIHIFCRALDNSFFKSRATTVADEFVNLFFRRTSPKVSVSSKDLKRQIEIVNFSYKTNWKEHNTKFRLNLTLNAYILSQMLLQSADTYSNIFLTPTLPNEKSNVALNEESRQKVHAIHIAREERRQTLMSQAAFTPLAIVLPLFNPTPFIASPTVQSTSCTFPDTPLFGSSSSSAFMSPVSSSSPAANGLVSPINQSSAFDFSKTGSECNRVNTFIPSSTPMNSPSTPFTMMRGMSSESSLNRFSVISTASPPAVPARAHSMTGSLILPSVVQKNASQIPVHSNPAVTNSAVTAATRLNIRCLVKHDFFAADQHQLSLRVGQSLLIRRDCGSCGWYVGCLEFNQTQVGLFPKLVMTYHSTAQKHFLTLFHPFGLFIVVFSLFRCM